MTEVETGGCLLAAVVHVVYDGLILLYSPMKCCDRGYEVSPTHSYEGEMMRVAMLIRSSSTLAVFTEKLRASLHSWTDVIT
eukprot:scaffold25695_cov108-Cylindrotheca_fusiformis.AAC.3